METSHDEQERQLLGPARAGATLVSSKAWPDMNMGPARRAGDCDVPSPRTPPAPQRAGLQSVVTLNGWAFAAPDEQRVKIPPCWQNGSSAIGRGWLRVLGGLQWPIHRPPLDAVDRRLRVRIIVTTASPSTHGSLARLIYLPRAIGVSAGSSTPVFRRARLLSMS